MRTALIAVLALVASSTALAGPRYHTRPAPAATSRGHVVTIMPAPVVVLAPAYRPDHVWIEGHWQGRYWVPGHWEAVAPPPPVVGVSVGVGGVHVAVNTWR